MTGLPGATRTKRVSCSGEHSKNFSLVTTVSLINSNLESTLMRQIPLFRLMRFGTSEQLSQRQSWILSGEALEAYFLPEPHSGSDAAAFSSTEVRDANMHVLNGTKSWISHGGVADFYPVFSRTGPLKESGISCFFYRTERVMRDSKVLQFVERTNQIQRVIVSRELRKDQ